MPATVTISDNVARATMGRGVAGGTSVNEKRFALIGRAIQFLSAAHFIARVISTQILDFFG